MAAPEDAGSIYSDVRIRLDKLNADISAVKTGFDKMGKTIETSSDKSTNTMTKNFDAIKLAGTGAIIAITLAFKQAIKTFTDTEQQLANVRAVSNSTAKDFKLLEDAAKDAGVSTRFTASEAADALFFLSSAGLKATESVKALDGVLLLAGATGSGLAESSQAITSTLSQFGLEASKAADVSNIFAAANSNSQATLDKLANSLRQVGPVAAGLGIGLEETVGSLQALYNAGFQGENAGRALKSALADLANEASPTIKKLDALGVSFSQVDPTVVGLTGAIGALEKAGITTAQVIDVFGKEAGPQLATLIGEGEAALKDYTKAVTGTNEAARQYGIQNDTLAGSQDAFKSALEGTTNSFIEQLTPAFRGVIDLGTGFLKLINLFPDILKAFGSGAVTAGLGVLGLSKALAFLPGVFGAIGVSLGTALGPVALIGGVVIGLTAMVKKAQEVRQVKLADEFGDLATQLGYTGTALDDFVKSSGKVEAAFRSIATDLPATFKRTNDLVAELSKKLGLSEEEVISIALSATKVSDEYKAQLTTIQDQLTEQKLLNNSMRSTDEIAQGIASVEEYNQRRKAKAAQERADLERKELDRAERLATIDKERLTLNELYSKGLITEEDLLNEKIRLRQEEKDLLIAKSITEGKVTQQSIDDINKQQYWIDQYNKDLQRITDTKNTEADNDKKRLSDAEKLEETKKSFIDFYDKKLAESSKTKAQLLEEEYEAAIAFANKTGLDTKKIDEFYNAEKNKDNFKLIEDLTFKIKKSTQTKKDALSEERTNAVSAAVATGKDTAEIEQYYSNESNKLDKEEKDIKIENYKQSALSIISVASSLYSTLVSARTNAINAEIAEIKRVTDEELENVDIRTQALLTAQGLQEETKLESLQRQLDAVNGVTQSETELLDIATQKKLADLGLLEDTKLQSLQKQLDASKLAGDTEKELELQKEIDRTKILEDAAAEKDRINKKATAKELEDEIARTKILQDASDEKAKIEKEAAKKTVDLKYESDIAQWESAKINATITGAQAALSVYNSLAWLGPLVAGLGAGASLFATGVYVDSINKNKPKKQTFATGGIVLPEAGVSSTGDRINAGLNPYELVLNPKQQAETLFRIANGGGGGNTGDTMIQLFMDSKVVAQGVARNFNNGVVKVMLK